ncbi:MAG TPA: hypothetical protein VKV03_06775 [Candidatus Binataceae bacterium]|nr:hypothetical protein [Candidatus Binataceae bacterium]
MAILLAILFSTLPLDAFGRVVAGSLVTPADVVAVVVALMTLERLATGRYRVSANLDPPIIVFATFLFIGAMSVVLSNDSHQIFIKGFVQVGGIAIMLLACIATANEIARRPVLFASYIRLCTIILAIVALIGVVQFVFANALSHPEILDFSFLNRWAGGNVWYNRGSLDGIVRANSILQEPSALGMVLGTIAGVALIRFGVAGVARRDAIRSVIPGWSAILIVAGFVVTVSLIDFFLLLVVSVSIWMVSRTSSASVFAGLFGATIVIGGVAYSAIASTLPDLNAKIAAMSSLASDDLRVERAEDLSAIALAVNVAVMRANLARAPMIGAGLGAHPITYDRENPGLGRLPADIMTVGLNKEDAASLLIRLLSESGMLGAAAFIMGWVVAVVRARRAILASINAGVTPNAFSSLAIGITASTVGIGVACMIRAPQYYAPWFWLPMALTVSVPELIARVKHESRGRHRAA